LTGLAVALLLIALARPQWRVTRIQQVSETRDMMLTLDVSLSMSGFMPSTIGQTPVQKLDAMQDAALEFVRRRPDDRLGLIVFGDEAFGVWPLSTDTTMIEQRIQRLDTLLPAELRGTNVTKAFMTSLDHLQEQGQADTKLLILLTDGIDTIAPAMAEQIAQRLNQLRITLYVLGLELRQDASLIQFARRVAGHYVDINNAAELERALRDIDRLETSAVNLIEHTEAKELYPYFVIPGLICFAVTVALKSTWALDV
jgi:Ca-activated chloride channel family protein